MPTPVERTSIEGARILVVDDEVLNRDLLGRRLERRGFSVHAVEGGRQALAYLAAHPVDVVMLDIQMPEMSGLEVLQHIRGRDEWSHLPVLMATAKVQSDDIVTALELGADDYITKPIDFSVALARVKTLIRRKRAEDVVRESEERYALAVAGANDGLWDWNLATNEVHFSDRWKSIVGYQSEEIGVSPEEWFSRIHPHDAARVRREVEAHLAGLTPLFESEHRIQHKSGAFRWVLTRGLSTRTPTGAPSRMAGSQTDITEGKVVDALTGLPNRVLLLDRLDRVLQSSRAKPDLLFAVLFLDLDGFKLINDSFGHLVGDELIQAVSARLEASLRAGDVSSRAVHVATQSASGEHTIARLGGDEFIVLLHNVRSVVDATRVAERIQLALARPFELAGRQVFTSASIGVAVSTGGYSRPDELLRDADTAMYRAKALGKARCEVFDAAMREEVVARLRLETAVRLGVERHEFLPYYQPIVDFTSGRLVGFEALLRWNRPGVGVLPPSEFLQVVEDNGLLVPIGRRLIRDVCTQLKAWQTATPGARDLWVNINVASQQLISEDMATRLVECLDEAGLSARNIVVEITEATAIDNFARTATILSRLRDHGVRVVLDDFGTGYSSLACLDQLPISGLKLDPTFTLGEAKRPEILGAVVALAHSLGLTVTAEGIETPEQYDRLKALGCQYAQGYLFARPLTAEQVEQLLVTHPNGFDVTAGARPSSASAPTM